MGSVDALAGSPSEDLIKQGLELRRAGRDFDALKKFEEAYGTSKTPRAAAQWGLCLQAVSKWAEADALLSEALSAAQDPWVKKNRNVLKESVEAVKAHMGRIEVIGEPVGATVTVAGTVVGVFPLPSPVTVNEGSVDVEVTAKGFKRSGRTLTVAGASYQRVVLRLEREGTESLAIAKVAAPVENEQTPANLLQAPATSEQPPSITKSPWFWGAVGLAVLGAAATVLLLSRDQYESADARRTIP